jgi:hypothetical protein
VAIQDDDETHAELLRLAAGDDRTLPATVADATSVLRRERFAQRIAVQLEQLRSDPLAWHS